VREAEAHADKDKQRKEMVDARNEADSLAYSTEKSLAEHKAKLPAATVDAITAAIGAARAAAAGEDLPKLKEAVAALNTAAMEIGKALAGQSGGGGAAGGDAGAAGGAGASGGAAGGASQ